MKCAIGGYDHMRAHLYSRYHHKGASDYRLWGHLRAKLYISGELIHTLDDLESRLLYELNAILIDIYHRVFHDFEEWIEQCINKDYSLTKS